jgi:23S rRNA (guanine745-N1)-methyltransferase
LGPDLDALDRSLTVLACPLCSAGLQRIEHALRCANGHAFDIARQGYPSFTTGGGPHHQGDTADMVAARTSFLSGGHYERIADAIAAASPRHGWCVELAGGTGYYIARTLDAVPDLEGVTLDVSKHAARVASRVHPRLASVAADATARLPLASGSVDLVLSVFGPRRGDEVARILAPGGTVVVVTPRAAHLAQLRERFALLAIGADKEARLRTTMLPLVPTGETELEYVVSLGPREVVDSIMMGPNAFHVDRSEIETQAAAAPEAIETTVSVTITTFSAAT